MPVVDYYRKSNKVLEVSCFPGMSFLNPVLFHETVLLPGWTSERRPPRSVPFCHDTRRWYAD